MPESFSPLDYETVRRLVFERTAAAVAQRFPISNERFSLSVEDLALEGPETFSLEDQNQAILNGKTLGRPLKGTWVMHDLEGNEISRTGRRTVLNIPYLTNRGTFIRNGNEILLSYQMRLVPGVYTRRAADETPEAHVNIKKGTGSTFKIQMDPKTSIFHMRYHNRKIPLYPVLRKMGVTDEQLTTSWGADVLKANAAKGHNIRRTTAPETIGALPPVETKLDGQTIVPQKELEAQFAPK